MELGIRNQAWVSMDTVARFLEKDVGFRSGVIKFEYAVENGSIETRYEGEYPYRSANWDVLRSTVSSEVF